MYATSLERIQKTVPNFGTGEKAITYQPYTLKVFIFPAWILGIWLPGGIKAIYLL
jgi:hypothetical protein